MTVEDWAEIRRLRSVEGCDRVVSLCNHTSEALERGLP